MTPDNKPAPDLDLLCIDTIRTLAMDAVQQANAGHPGTPMALAPLAYALYMRHLRHSPRHPDWPDRDRFVLSCGHASMLLYASLYLTGYDLSLDELRHFRQWDSRTPGHPEHGLTPGVETTTGPLGQGFANGVGMAIAEAHLAARFNRPGHEIVNHFTYAIASDGDLMEGISHEAASLAGHLKLGKLIYCYDDNHITIEGKTDLAFTEDVAQRFAGYGWHVQRVADANDLAAFDAAIRAAKDETGRPSLVIVRSHIGWGSPHKQDTAEAHGSPLGAEEVALTKAAYGWPASPPFLVPDAAKAHMGGCVERGAALEAEWGGRVAAYAKAFPDLAAEWRAALAGDLPPGWERALPAFTAADGSQATRIWSSRVLNALAPVVRTLVGGAADLAPSTNTLIKDGGDLEAGSLGARNMHFGIREHGMGGVLNGMALHRGVRPYGATFFIFTDYMRPSIRLAALMGLPVIYVFTHDSVGLGEDGPTHQPIEQLAAMRAIPHLTVIRPADGPETAQAWRAALLNTGGPTALVLTRQKVRGDRPGTSGLGRRYAARRLRAGGGLGWSAASGADGHGLGGGAVPRGAGEARGRGHADPGGQHAEPGDVRAPGRGVSRRGAAARRARPAGRRGGVALRLAPLGRNGRRRAGHRALRRVGALRADSGGVRFHG